MRFLNYFSRYKLNRKIKKKENKTNLKCLIIAIIIKKNIIVVYRIQ